ncbi:MAG: M23 family metallopeptidase [Clostridia bacterium]|jgi:murein DD-endopeptidase MepM/ murein hydrolase activator NlpD|nr:M23 family metallopeptidase [Clostridia bacterium]
MVSVNYFKNKLCPKLRQLKKRKKDNKRTSLTMIVIPHCQEKAVKNISLPFWLVKFTVILGVICLLTVGYFVCGYFSLHYLAKENKALQQVNAVQAVEIEELKDMTGDMQNKLEGLMQIDREVREKVGLSKSKEEEEALIALQASRGLNNYSLLTIGLAERQMRCPHCQKNFCLENTSSVVQCPGQHKELSDLAEKDALEDLRVELAKVDFLLTSQARTMEKLKLDVEAQDARPMAWPFRGYITSQFGSRKNPFDHSKEEFHEGIDIDGPYGAPIRAAGKGVVTFAGSKGNWGNMVLISHGFGYVSLYAHNSSLLVEKNDQVEKGQIIARLGSTGRCTGAHLHFGIAKNGEWVDPLEILK